MCMFISLLGQLQQLKYLERKCTPTSVRSRVWLGRTPFITIQWQVWKIQNQRTLKKFNYNKIIHTAGCISKTSISIKYRNNRMLHWYKSRNKILFSLILSDYICLIYITSEQKMRRRMLGKKGSTWLQRRFVEFVPCVTLLLPRPTKSSECWSKKVKKKTI